MTEQVVFAVLLLDFEKAYNLEPAERRKMRMMAQPSHMIVSPCSTLSCEWDLKVELRPSTL